MATSSYNYSGVTLKRKTFHLLPSLTLGFLLNSFCEIIFLANRNKNKPWLQLAQWNQQQANLASSIYITLFFFRICSLWLSWWHVKCVSPTNIVFMWACVWERVHTHKKKNSTGLLVLYALHKLGVYLAFDLRVQECDWSLLGCWVVLQLLLANWLYWAPKACWNKHGLQKKFHKKFILFCNKIIYFYLKFLYFLF